MAWKDKSYKKLYAKNYYEKNKVVFLEKRKEYHKNNREKCLIGMRDYYINNRKERLKYRKEYYEKNKTEINRKNTIKNRERRYLDKDYAIKIRLRKNLWRAFKQYNLGKKLKSSKYGINYQAIMESLKPFPKDISQYEIDHIKPLFSFDLRNPQQIREAFTPENHQWLLKSINRQKGARERWLKEQE